MAKTYIQDGETLRLTAPIGGVTNGVPILIGQFFGVPQQTALVGESFELMVEGVHSLPKPAGAGISFAEGDACYWDSAAKKITSVATGHSFVGAATEAAGAAASTVNVRLNESTLDADSAALAAATTDTGGGAGNAGKLVKLDAGGKLDDRDVGADGATLDGLAAGAAQAVLKNGTVAMTADLNLGTHKISNVVDPAAAQDAATKNYVDGKAVIGALKYAQVVVASGGAAYSAAKPADFVNDKPCWAACQNSTSNAVYLRKVVCTAGDLTVLLSGDPGVSTAIMNVWQDIR